MAGFAVGVEANFPCDNMPPKAMKKGRGKAKAKASGKAKAKLVAGKAAGMAGQVAMAAQGMKSAKRRPPLLKPVGKKLKRAPLPGGPSQTVWPPGKGNPLPKKSASLQVESLWLPPVL